MNSELYKDPDYIQGQIAALRAMILGLAQNTSPEEFRYHSLERLENLKTAILNHPVSDARLLAIDECISWVKTVAP